MDVQKQRRRWVHLAAINYPGLMGIDQRCGNLVEVVTKRADVAFFEIVTSLQLPETSWRSMQRLVGKLSKSTVGVVREASHPQLPPGSVQ